MGREVPMMSNLVLRLKIASFAAIQAVVKPILAKPHVVLTLAQAAEFFTLAEGLFFSALKTNKFICHGLSGTCGFSFSNFIANRELLKRKLQIARSTSQ